MDVLPILKTSRGKRHRLYEGDTRNPDLTFQLKKESDGTVLDITGWVLEARIKKDVLDLDAVSLSGTNPIAITIPLGTDGKFIIPFKTNSVMISEKHEGAVLIVYRVVDTKKQIKLQFEVDIL